MFAKLTICWLTWTCWFPPPSLNCDTKVYACQTTELDLRRPTGREVWD